MNSKICFIRKYAHWRIIKLSQILEYNSLRIPFRQIKATAIKNRQSNLANSRSQIQKFKSLRTYVEVVINREKKEGIIRALDVQFPKEYETKVRQSKRIKSESIVDLFSTTKEQKSKSGRNEITPLQAKRRTSLINTKNYLTIPLELDKTAFESRLLKQVRLLKRNAKQTSVIQKSGNPDMIAYLSLIDSIRDKEG